MKKSLLITVASTIILGVSTVIPSICVFADEVTTLAPQSQLIGEENDLPVQKYLILIFPRLMLTS